jgi:hypothetical protein
MITRAVLPNEFAPPRAVWLVVMLVSTLGASQASAQISLVLGAGGGSGTLQKPYVYNCDENDTEGSGVATLLYAGAGVSAFTLTAGYLTANGSGACLVSPPQPDGVQRIREFRAGGAGGTYGWLFHLRYSPNSIPFMVYGGTGIRFGTQALGHNRLMSLGAALRTHGRLSVFVGGEVNQVRTQYVRFERQWQSGEIVSSTEIERGHDWRKLEFFRFGLEYRWRFDN